MNIAAVVALPLHLVVLLEHGPVLDVGEQLAVPLLVPHLHLADLLEGLRHLGEPLLRGHLAEIRVQRAPLLKLAVGGGLQVHLRVAQGEGVARVVDHHAAHTVADQVLEEDLRVLPLVLRRLGEDVGDLDVPLLLRLRRVVRIPVPGLGLARKGLHEVLLGFGAFQGFHRVVPPFE